MKEKIKKLMVTYFYTQLSLIDCLARFVRKLNKNNKYSNDILIETICRSLEKVNKNCSYSIRSVPNNSLEKPFIKGLVQEEDLAIVLQGPISYKEQMTFNTVRFYREMYSCAKIIVSTWEDESEQTLHALRQLGAIVLCNQKPSSPGIHNVNYQLKNSLAGIEKAEQFGCNYVVKTRTDQRLCRPYIFDHMALLINMFPVTDSIHQKERIILLSNFNGSMFAPYMLSDFMYFGNISDIKKLLSAPFDTRSLFIDYSHVSRRNNAIMMASPEVFIIKHYLQNYLNYNCKDTIEFYWKAVKNYFICLDYGYVDLMWNKYGRRYQYNLFNSEYFGDLDSEYVQETMYFSFINWLNLYTGKMTYDSSYENFADQPLHLNE